MGGGPMENEDKFTHERLRLGGNSIRLITLFPCDNDYSFIICSINQYPLHRRPGYTALSYMWGSPNELHPIFLNGKKFMVRRNLYDCLNQLRKVHKEPITLWIDALCIDQDNIPERNHIVQIMDQVYERADQVYVWLGAGDDDSDQAMMFLQDITAALHATESPREVFFDQYMFPVNYHHDWRATTRLFIRNYWTRLWIIQETLLAPSLELFCGQHRVLWKDVQEIVVWIAKLLEYYKERKGGSPELYAAICNSLAGRMVLRRREFGSKRETYPSLQELLENFKDSECFAAHDNIFGLLGIASDFHKKRIDYIDYNLRTTEVFVNFLRHYLKAPSHDEDEESLWSLRRLSARHYSNPYRNSRSEETLWNVRRLSDALKIDIADILYRRNRSSDHWIQYSDLTLNGDDLKLSLPCTVVINFSDDETDNDLSIPSCTLRNCYSSELRSPATPTNTLFSPLLRNASVSPLNPAEELPKLRYLARSNGYKICNAINALGDDLDKDTASSLNNADSNSFRYFDRSNDKNNASTRPCFGITCSASRPGDVLVKSSESDLVFVARHSHGGVYDVIGTAMIHEDSSVLLKLKTSIRKQLTSYHNRHGSEGLSPVSAQDPSPGTSFSSTSCSVTTTSSSTPSSPNLETPTDQSPGSVTVRFNPLTLLMIVNDPNWRKEQINNHHHRLKLHTRKPSSYMAIQPRGDDDPVLKSFGTKVITRMPHIDRGVNKVWDRTVVKMEEFKGVRYYFDDDSAI